MSIATSRAATLLDKGFHSVRLMSFHVSFSDREELDLLIRVLSSELIFKAARISFLKQDTNWGSPC